MARKKENGNSKLEIRMTNQIRNSNDETVFVFVSNFEF